MPDASSSKPPVAATRPVRLTAHGDTRVDPYYWMRERESDEVLAYLKAENDYTEACTAHTATLRKELFDELLGRIQEDDASVPVRDGPYDYYRRTEEGRPYAIHCRKRADDEGAAEEIVLDENELAEGHDYFALGALELSPDHRLAAFSVDTNGAEKFTVRVKDLATGELLDDVLVETSYSLEWAETGDHLFYTTMDDASRPWRVQRHALGSPASSDAVILEEPDERFWVGVGKTRSRAFILIHCGSKMTDEWHALPADQPTATPQVIAARRQGIEYSVSHHSDRFLIVTNEDAVQFRLMEAPVATPGADHWREVIAARDDVTLLAVEAFQHHLVIHERAGGLPCFRIRDLRSGDEHSITFPEPTYTAHAGHNPSFDTTTYRFGYQSLVTPPSVFDYDLESRDRVRRKQLPIKGGYDADQYISERLHARAPDGTEVPISLVRHRSTPVDGSAPLLLYGYGSYGSNSEPAFRSTRLSLLNRGIIFAIAHIRGGGEMGRTWYESGKFLQKQNTFSDFIASAEHLVAENYTQPDRLAIRGGSAGGLLIGAVLNQRPDLFHVAIAHVPFVDVVTTMSDDTIPLTVIEYEEWGNPAEPEFYAAMKAYSPYDNVQAADYPALLITAGLNDPRVQYWEPAKWCARLRVSSTGDATLLLKTHMGAGHAGASGRYGELEDLAFEFAFLLDQLGLADRPAT